MSVLININNTNKVVKRIYKVLWFRRFFFFFLYIIWQTNLSQNKIIKILKFKTHRRINRAGKKQVPNLTAFLHENYLTLSNLYLSLPVVSDILKTSQPFLRSCYNLWKFHDTYFDSYVAERWFLTFCQSCISVIIILILKSIHFDMNNHLFIIFKESRTIFHDPQIENHRPRVQRKCIVLV